MIMMQNRQGEASTRRNLEELSMDEFELNIELVCLFHQLIQNESVKNNHNASSQTIIKILRFLIAILSWPMMACFRIKIMRKI